ncbi:Uncharacterised protein [Neisseria meningitidis]|nr:Uncharacterised protein [Neisseria meningitidis]CWT95845.1 Uncharacterised protein [Neisseria meningitidis]
MCSSSDSKSRRSDVSARYGVLRVQRILDFGKFCQQVFKQQHFLAAQHFLDSVVTLVHFFADFLIQLLALGSQLQKNTSLEGFRRTTKPAFSRRVRIPVRLGRRIHA